MVKCSRLTLPELHDKNSNTYKPSQYEVEIEWNEALYPVIRITLEQQTLIKFLMLFTWFLYVSLNAPNFLQIAESLHRIVPFMLPLTVVNVPKK